MLNPNNNKDRLYYGNILSPPENYQLDFAIGTTYSLDLDALVGASISLGLSDDIDSNLKDNPIYLLEALRSISDKVLLFCENGQIKLPYNPTPLYVLLENMVFQVKTSQYIKNKYASFHPKFWLLRYVKEDDFVYRVVVLSRNLTFDRNWDISFAMDGYKNDIQTEKNDPIIEFIDYLIEFSTDDEKTNKMKKLMNELKFIEFNLDSKIFNDFDFFVNGIGQDYKIQNDSLFQNNSINNILIVSPFLSKDVISNFNSRINSSAEALLFTRLNSIASLKQEDCCNFDIYVLKDEIIDGESIVSEDEESIEQEEKNDDEIIISEDIEEIHKQDIHAKIYAIENEKYTELYLGSLNASHNALYGNIEFMIKLQAKNKKLNIKNLADDLFNGEKGGAKCPFKLINLEEYDLIEETDEESFDLIIKYISRLNSTANITFSNDLYGIEVNFENLDLEKLQNWDVSIRPLLSNKKSIFSNKIVFDNLNKLSLSEFFVITINNKLNRVIKIPTKGMPDDREKDVISDIITDENAFIKYVAFLLGDDFILNIDNTFVGKGANGTNIQLPELYEKMLKATIYSPEKFNEIEFLINALSDDNVIPDGFEELYNTFLEVLN